MNTSVLTSTPSARAGDAAGGPLAPRLDGDALPPGTLDNADLKSPATTVALLKLNPVVGLKATVAAGGTSSLLRIRV